MIKHFRNNPPLSNYFSILPFSSSSNKFNFYFSPPSPLFLSLVSYYIYSPCPPKTSRSKPNSAKAPTPKYTVPNVSPTNPPTPSKSSVSTTSPPANNKTPSTKSVSSPPSNPTTSSVTKKPSLKMAASGTPFP